MPFVDELVEASEAMAHIYFAERDVVLLRRFAESMVTLPAEMQAVSDKAFRARLNALARLN